MTVEVLIEKLETFNGDDEVTIRVLDDNRKPGNDYYIGVIVEHIGRGYIELQGIEET